MWLLITIFSIVFIATVVAIIILKKKPTPFPTPPLPSFPIPVPSPTPTPPETTFLEVLSSEDNTQDILSIRVDGKLVVGPFPLTPGHIGMYSTDVVGTGLDVQIRFSGLPAETESIALYCGSYQSCITGPTILHDFIGLTLNGTKINIDYDKIGC